MQNHEELMHPLHQQLIRDLKSIIKKSSHNLALTDDELALFRKIINE